MPRSPFYFIFLSWLQGHACHAEARSHAVRALANLAVYTHTHIHTVHAQQLPPPGIHTYIHICSHTKATHTADVLCAVDGNDIDNIPPDHMNELLLGEKGSWVVVCLLFNMETCNHDCFECFKTFLSTSCR